MPIHLFFHSTFYLLRPNYPSLGILSLNFTEMKRIYHKIKSHFLEVEKELDLEERKLLRNAKYFFVFSILLIISVLLYYSKTREEFLPLIALGITAAVFWTHSDKRGKVFMVAAASLGFAHEVVGGMEGWFVYTSGIFFQTPLWLIPGYAAMYWACYNLWKHGKNKYKIKERNFTILSVSLIALMFILDATVCNFRPAYWAFDIAVIAIVVLLFRLTADKHLALVTWCMVAFDEFLGFSLCAWQHYSYAGQVSTLAGPVDITAAGFATGFSFTGITPTYLLFLWGSLRLAEFLEGKKRILKREIALIAAAICLKTYTWLTSSIILAALFAGGLF